MRIVIFTLFAALLFCSCSDDTTTLLNNNNLAPEIYTIHTERDTVLHTAKGAIISIPAGTLQCASGNARIAIKEAYTMKDMMLAGLVTEAGDKPLSSGGMINITADSGEQVTITKGIEVKIPAKVTQPGMQLYNGVPKPDGSIDWVDPKPLNQKVKSKTDSGKSGEVLFNANCSSCHNPTKEATGPPLAFLRSRRTSTWLYHFVNRDFVAFSYSCGDCDDRGVFWYNDYAWCLNAHYNIAMTHWFKNLSHEEVARIYEYVDAMAKGTDPASIRDYKAAFDSCQLYNKTVKTLEEKRQILVEENGPEVKKGNTAAAF